MKNKLEKLILQHMTKSTASEFSFKTLCKIFNIKGQQRHNLKDALLNLEENGFIKYKPKQKYILQEVKEIEAQQNIKRNDKTKKVSKNNSITKEYNKVLAVYNEHSDTYTPLLNELGKIQLQALDQDANNNKLKNGNIVYINPIKPKGSKTVKAARFVEFVAESIHGHESFVSIANAGLSFEFPDEVITEVEQIKSGLSKEEIAKREDLRKTPLVTIDGSDARDFDDAVFAEKWLDRNGKDKGGYHIIVAIADVAYYIKKGSALEAEALKRGNSTYFPDMVVPMLPERLCNDLCSLNPDVERPVLAAHLYIDKNGNLKDYKFSRAVIKSHKRLTYDQVQDAIEGKFSDYLDINFYKDVIIPLEDAFEALASKRDKRGALDLDTTETQIVLDGNNVVDIIDKRRFKAHMIIEEMMILANIAAAKALEKFACMYRVHEEPSKEKIQNLQSSLRGLQVKYYFDNAKNVKPFDFKKLIEKMQKMPSADSMMGIILRSQSQARYSADNLGHFGLALTHYAHFTSPIRRFSDLIVHRLLIANLKLASKGGVKYSNDEINDIAENISDTERVSQKAEWDSKERFIASYYANKLNNVFEGTVVSITSFGMFVKLDTGAEGLLSFKSMTNDYYTFDERTNTLRGKRTRKIIKLGTKLKVRLKDCNIYFGKLGFDFVSFM